MRRKGIIWIITCLVLIIAISTALLLTQQNELQVGISKVEKLSPGQAISIDTKAENFGIQIGDVFSYFVNIYYNPEKVVDIDGKNLIKTINLIPFEIRDVSEKNIKINNVTYVHEVQFKIQLVNGDIDHLYEFPSIVVKYKLNDSAGFLEIPCAAEPVYVSSRLPDKIENPISNLDFGYGLLRPLKGEANSLGGNQFAWVLLISGIVLGIGTVTDYYFRILPQKKNENENEKLEKSKLIYQAYKALYKDKENFILNGKIFYQIDHIVKLVLIKNEKIDLQEEFNPEMIPLEIREDVTSIFNINEKIQKNNLKDKNISKSLENLDKILRFYYGEEVDTWKS